LNQLLGQFRGHFSRIPATATIGMPVATGTLEMTKRSKTMDTTMHSGTSAADTGDSGEAVRQLNSLLRGEISAAETYRMAIEKVADEADVANAGLLREIQEEHGRAAQGIRDRIRELGGEASDSSG